MKSEDQGPDAEGSSMGWSLVRWIPENSGFGPSQIFSFLRPLEDGELAAINAAEALFRNFGASFANNAAIRLANDVGNTASSLLSAIKRSGGEVNQADVNRFRWALVEFAKHIVSWTTDSEASEAFGRVAREVASVSAVVDCSFLAGGADFGIALEPEQSGATRFVLTALDPADSGRRVNALGLMQSAIHACQPLAAASLMEAEEDLKEAAKRLMSLQVEVMWGSPALAALPEPEPGQLASTSLQPRPIAFGDIAPVLAACEIARGQSQTPGSPATPQVLVSPAEVDTSTQQEGIRDAETGVGAVSEESKRDPDETGAGQPENVHAPAIDIAALLREATALSIESEQTWSIAQGSGLLERINNLEGRAASVLMALQAQVAAGSGPEVTATVPSWPMSPDSANELEGDYSGPVPAGQKALAAVLAVANLVDAMGQLRAPSKTTLNLVSGDQLSWWAPDAFTRLRAAAALAAQLIAGNAFPQLDARLWCLDRAEQCLDAGLIDATMLYLIAAIGDDKTMIEPLANAHAALRTSVQRFLESGLSRPDVTLPIATYWLRALQEDRDESAIHTPSAPADE